MMRLSIPTIEDCARLRGLDASGLPRRRPEPTLREIRIAAQLLRTPAGVWMPRAWVEAFIEQNAIREREPFDGWYDFADLSADYNEMMYGASVGTGYWREWTGDDDSKIEWYASGERPSATFFSFPAEVKEVTLNVDTRPPLPPDDNIAKLKLQLEVQYNRALENMAKTLASDFGRLAANFMFNANPVLQRLDDSVIKKEDFDQRETKPPEAPGEVFFSIPAMAMPKFQFGFTGFKAASMGIDTAGTFLWQQMQYRDWDDVEMARLERQGFGIEVVKEEKVGE